MKIEDIVMHDTHIEVHTVNGVPVYVKRDDLCTASPRLPNLCKVRALVPILLDLKERGIERVAVYSTRISRTGWATAGLCQLLKLRCTYYYPVFVGKDTAPLLTVTLARGMGANIIALLVRDNTVSHYDEAATIALNAGEYMLPYGLATQLAVEAYRAEAATIPSHFVEGGTVVGCAGSGTTLLSVQAEMPDSTSVIGVQVGGALVEPSLQVVLSPYTYYNIAKEYLS